VDLFSATQYLLCLVIVSILVKPLGGYLERVFSRKHTALDRHRHPNFPLADQPGIISLSPLEKSLVVGEPTGMMTPDKKGEGFLPGIEFQATTDTHLCSRKGGRIDRAEQ